MTLGERLRPALIPLIASLTLGLAPFTPQPHVVEKLTWLIYSEHTFAAIDVFDLLMHGAPWVWLVWTVVNALRPQRRSDGRSSDVALR